jgi:hypothetical protein
MRRYIWLVCRKHDSWYAASPTLSRYDIAIALDRGSDATWLLLGMLQSCQAHNLPHAMPAPGTGFQNVLSRG